MLINNAAMIGRLAPFHELGRDECEEVFRANVLGPMELARLAARHLIRRGASGTIINVLTIQTLLPLPAYSAYVASKGGLDALTLAMAVDLAPHALVCTATTGARRRMEARTASGNRYIVRTP